MINAPSTHTILIADDDPDVLFLTDLVVAHAGFKTLLARDGKVALEMAREHRPSLLLLDIMMPELHGIAVCHQLKSDPETKNIKIIVMSAKSYSADKEQAAEAGADLFMGKPVNQKELIEKIKNLLGMKD